MAANTAESQIAGTEGTYVAQTFDNTAAGYEDKYLAGMQVNERVTVSTLTIEDTNGGTSIIADYVDTANVTFLEPGTLIKFHRNNRPGYVNVTTGSFNFIYLINE